MRRVGQARDWFAGELPFIAYGETGSPYAAERIPEDWPGEAALVEAEMRRFRKWAEWKVASLVSLHMNVHDFGLFVRDGRYAVVHLGLVACPGARRVWP